MNGDIFQIIDPKLLLIVSVVESLDVVEVHILAEDLALDCFRSAFFSLHADGMITSLWILLDNCLTSSVCNNEAMIGNVSNCTSGETLMVYTNGGSKTFINISPFFFLPLEIHFNPDSMANILTIKYVA